MEDIEKQKEQIAEILKNDIHYSPQVGTYVIHGAVEKLYSLIKAAQSTPDTGENQTVHELKIWKEYFDDVDSGRKPFEVRKLDRLFGVGDILRLREWGNISGYTGRETKKRIIYIMKGGQWGLIEGNCILGLAAQSTEAAQAIEVIQELVFLKNYKDLNGKDDLYNQRQPKAWETAKQLLKTQQP